MRICNLLLSLLLLPGWIAAITHTVKLDGSGDYSSIQAALDASVPGDTVLVHPGTYYENVSIQTNSISLISLEAITGISGYIASTVIDGNMINPCIRVTQGRTGVYVRGLSITHGFNTGSGGGMLLSTGSNTSISNCSIYNNTAKNGGGINVVGATAYLSGVAFFENYALNLGGGLYCTSVTGFNHSLVFDPVNRCSIYNNRSGAGQDIYIQNAVSDLNVYLDTFSVVEPTTYYAIYRPEGSAEYQMNIDVLNAHHQEIDCDLFVSPDGDDTNDGLSPATALKTIHEGIYRIAADSLNQNTVHLLPGIYSRAANNQVFPIALKSWTIVQGSGVGSSVIIGELHPLITVGMNPHNDVFMSNYQDTVTLSYISISTLNSNNDTAVFGNSFGSLNLSQINISSLNPDDSSAIWVYLSSEYESTWESVTIENITTPDMGLLDIGGSMRGKISNCKFRNATSTYTSASVWAYPLVSFRGDRYLAFENCEFSNLTMLDDNSNAIQIGGVQFPEQSNTFVFNNCLFSNISSPGGVMLAASSNHPNISFTNCTFAGNDSDTYSLQVNGNVNITNCIFDNDTPYQIKVNPMTGLNETTTLNIDYSCVKDGIQGIQQAAGNTINYAVTNNDSDPLFRGGDIPTDPLNYSLSELSPCIDTGTPDITGLDLLPYDLAWNWRVWNGRIDMGCYEYGSEPWVGNDDPVVPVPNGVMSVYPNPFRSYANIRVELDDAMQNARLEVYNLRGQKVKSIALDAVGRGQSWWDGRDDSGKLCANGVYVLSLNVNNKVIQSKRVTLLK